jgi:hypothetical protein
MDLDGPGLSRGRGVLLRPRRRPGARVVSGRAGPPPEIPLGALIRVEHDVAMRAVILGAQQLSVELPGVSERLWFSYTHGRVEVCGQGWELELSALEEWERERPPGL